LKAANKIYYVAHYIVSSRSVGAEMGASLWTIVEEMAGECGIKLTKYR
jgi:hypothetical protein